MSVCINKALLESGHVHCLHTNNGCFCPLMAQLSRLNKGHVAHKDQNIYIWPFTKKFADSVLFHVFVIVHLHGSIVFHCGTLHNLHSCSVYWKDPRFWPLQRALL